MYQLNAVPDNSDIVMETIEEYLQDHYGLLAEPDFEETLKEDLFQLFCPSVERVGAASKKKRAPTEAEQELHEEEDAQTQEIVTQIEEGIQHFFTFVMPRRSFANSFIFQTPNREKIQSQLQHLQNKPQPAQRTDAWYQFRHNLITASELSKVFDTPAQQNSLIYSKCKPWEPMGRCNNPASPLHWGQKYEPLSVMLYEHVYQTKVGEFGCIAHETLPFLGASPDGINIDPASPRFGRLLEIKNVLSREIDGVPLKEYWIQMQAQMEVCDLDECDFLETKFVEYDGYQSYVADKLGGGGGEGCRKQEAAAEEEPEEEEASPPCPYHFKGCIMMFMLPNTNTPVYEYKPLLLNDDDEETVWEEDMLRSYEDKGYQWITNVYWKLQVFSCVLVLRNRFWFQASVPQIREIWETIERERVSGYDYRAPKSRSSKKIDVTLLPPVDVGSSSSCEV